jgi:hypothetical protein
MADSFVAYYAIIIANWQILVNQKIMLKMPTILLWHKNNTSF